MRNKRGSDFTINQLFTLILVIIGFVMLIAVLYMNTDILKSEDKVCQFSVLARASAPSEAQGIIPLKCKTKKICLTQDVKNACKEAFGTNKDVEIIKLSDKPEEAIAKIEEESVKAYYNCWVMMGEGKVDIFGNYFRVRNLDVTIPTCVICSRVAVDISVKAELLDASRDGVNLEKYLTTHKVPGTNKNYIEVMSGGRANSYLSIEDKKKIEDESDKELQVRVSKGKPINIEKSVGRESAFVFGQVKVNDLTKVFTALAHDAVKYGSIALAVSPGGTFEVAKFFLLKKEGIFIGLLLAIKGGSEIIHNTWEGQVLAKAYCGEFVTNADRNEPDQYWQGCSLMQKVPYSADNINKICPQIEGYI